MGLIKLSGLLIVLFKLKNRVSIFAFKALLMFMVVLESGKSANSLTFKEYVPECSIPRNVNGLMFLYAHGIILQPCQVYYNIQ